MTFKVAKNIDLTDAEKEFLYNWRDSCIAESRSGLKTSTFISTLDKVSKADKQLLAGIGFNITKDMKDLCISDFCFEFSECLNEKIIREFERGLLLHF